VRFPGALGNVSPAAITIRGEVRREYAGLLRQLWLAVDWAILQ
jgi:hypothetical protein